VIQQEELERSKCPESIQTFLTTWTIEKTLGETCYKSRLGVEEKVLAALERRGGPAP